MIWKRYLLKEIVATFAFILCACYLLFMIFDYSFHMQDFMKDKQIQVADFLFYYGHLFIKRADLLIPLALLITTIRVLASLNTHRELLALQVAGISFKRVIRPFLLFGLCCTLFSYLSTEFISPRSETFLNQFRHRHFKHMLHVSGGDQKIKKERMHVVPLKDHSKIVYQYYDKEKGAYFDLIWIRSSEDIWRMKYLSLEGAHLVGSYVDHFRRDSEGFLDKRESFETYPFTELKWNPNTLKDAVVPFENCRPSQLWKLAHQEATTSYEKAEIWTHLSFKCVMPLLSLLVIIGVAPFCVRYARNEPFFFIYVFALFGYITFYLTMNAAVILGAGRALSPLFAIFTPFCLFTLPLIWKFNQTR
jgi:lipopolysaccharide export system permease protein